MQATKRIIGLAFQVLFFMAIALSAHARVYKWVDVDGRAHYSEQPPNEGDSAQLHIQAAPINPPPALNSSSTLSIQQGEQKRLNEVNARLKVERDLEASRERSRAEQRRIDEQEAEKKSKVDNALIDECKRNREIYCDKGVEKIRSELQWRNIRW